MVKTFNNDTLSNYSNQQGMQYLQAYQAKS